MTISPGYTNAQIRDYVYQYERLRQGTKALWLEEQPFSRYQLRRWKAAIFGGDLDRGLISRDGGGMIPHLGIRRRQLPAIGERCFHCHGQHVGLPNRRHRWQHFGLRQQYHRH